MAESSRPARSQSTEPDYIPGVYNYCDSWCGRCRFQSRCLVFQSVHAADRGEPEPEPAGANDGMARPWHDDLFNQPPLTSHESRELDAKMALQRRRTDADRLAILAKEYSHAAYPIVQALEPWLRDRKDDVAVAALEVLQHHALLISAKVVRSVHGSHDDDYDRFALQCDPHGSAKIARLAIKESRDAWDVLTQVGRAAADGVPKKMIEILTALDAALADRFPMAMDFVRDGFDTE